MSLNEVLDIHSFITSFCNNLAQIMLADQHYIVIYLNLTNRCLYCPIFVKPIYI